MALSPPVAGLPLTPITSTRVAPRCNAGLMRLGTHRAVAEVFAVDPHRREQQRDRRAGQQVPKLQAGGNAQAPMAYPGIDGRAPW